MKKSNVSSYFSMFLVFAFLFVSLFVPQVSANETLFFDNFDDGTPDGWQLKNGSWSILAEGSNKVYYQSEVAQEAYAYAGSNTWDNYTAEADLVLDDLSNRAYLCVRYSDNNNYYASSLYKDKIEIRKKVTGSSSTLVSKSYNLSPNIWYKVKFEINGSQLKMYINGNLELSATDSSLSNGCIALAGYKTAVKFDNVNVYTGPNITSPVTTSNNPAFKYGDLNGDGEINSTDSSLMKRLLLGIITTLPVENGFKVGDLNGDGEISSTDFALLKRYLLSIINKFPVENLITSTPVPPNTPTPTITSKPSATTTNTPKVSTPTSKPTSTPTLKPTPTSTQGTIVNPPSGSTLTITNTITVKSGTTYDGKGVKIIAVGMGNGSQDENQKPIFKLEKGASLKNVIIGAPGCDGVHCYGDNTVENVVWEDIGEDALTVKGEGTISIVGGSAKDGDDKCFQLNAACTFKVTRFSATNIGKFIRQNGDTTFKATIYLDSVTVNKAKECVARTDSKTTELYYRNCTFTNIPKLWVFPSTSQIHTY